jgi:ribose transport system substrate-binding protein
MKELSVLVSLITNENDFQRAQASDAQAAGARLHIPTRVVFSNNDAIEQTQQLLKAIQESAQRPGAIVVEPVGTGMVEVARAAVGAGIGWVILNHDVEYIPDLRNNCEAPVFAVSTDQTAIGEIQGKQFGAMLNAGGCVLYLEGPSTGGAARLRTFGMRATKPANVDVKALKGAWTEASGHRAVKSWLRLSTSRALKVSAVGCQNDAMAMGARRAFQELPDEDERQHWLSLPFTGCDGVPESGQEWVRRGILKATVVIRPNTGTALELLKSSMSSGTQPPERTLITPLSYPALEQLRS